MILSQTDSLAELDKETEIRQTHRQAFKDRDRGRDRGRDIQTDRPGRIARRGRVAPVREAARRRTDDPPTPLTPDGTRCSVRPGTS